MKRLIILIIVLLGIYLILPNIQTFNMQLYTLNIPESIETSRNSNLRSYNFKKYTLTTDMDLRTKSNLTENDYNELLKNTNLKNIGSALVKAENEYNINGLYLMGLCCLESAYGTSNFAVNRNNLVGWNANDSNPNNASYFNSFDDCILKVAAKLKKNYLTEGGCYFNGYSAKDIDVKYCSDKQHADKIVNIVNKLIKNVEVIE